MTTTEEPRSRRIARDVDAAVRWAGYRNKDLAEVLGISAGQVSHRINGKIEFSVSELDRIARWLDRPYDDFTGEGTAHGGRRKFSSGYIFARVHRRAAKPRIVPTPWGATPVEHRRAA